MFSRRAWSGRSAFRAFRRGRVAIDGQGAPAAVDGCRFGSSLDEHEARQVAALIERRLWRHQ